MDYSELLNLVIVPVITAVGWFLKTLITTVKKEIISQASKFDSLINQFSKFEVVLSHVKRDIDRANSELDKTELIAIKNHDRITKHGHEIHGIKANLKGIFTVLETLETQISALEKDLIKFEAKIPKTI